MKKYILFIFVLLSGFVYSQNGKIVIVELKNGYSVKGTIIEQSPDKSITIQTIGGDIFSYTADQVERISSTSQKSANSQLTISNIGVHTGFNISGVKEKDQFYYHANDPKSKMGLIFGVSGSVLLRQDLSLQIELNMERKGFKDKQSKYYDNTSNGTRVQKLNYITLPLIVNYVYVDKASKLTLNGGLGLYLGYIIGKDSWVNQNRDLGYVLNGSFQYPIQKDLYFEGTLRYNRGIVKIDNAFKNKSFLIGIGLIYHLDQNINL